MHSTTSNSLIHDRYTTTHFAAHQSDDATTFRQYDLSFGPLLPKSPDARILDIGCGMGFLLRWLDQRGYRNTQGFDLSDEQVEACRRSGLRNVTKVSDTVRELTHCPHPFDMVFMTDVLEHISKPAVIPILQAIHGSLKERGRALFRVPNLAAFSGPVRRYYDFTHEVGFVETSLKQVLEVSGFQNIEVLPEHSACRSAWKGLVLRGAREVLWGTMRLAMFVEGTGDMNPKVLTKNIIGVGSK